MSRPVDRQEERNGRDRFMQVWRDLVARCGLPYHSQRGQLRYSIKFSTWESAGEDRVTYIKACLAAHATVRCHGGTDSRAARRALAR